MKPYQIARVRTRWHVSATANLQKRKKDMLPGETVLSGCKLATTDDFQVLHSAAGYYIGTLKNGSPCTRETGYFPSEKAAKVALKVFKETGNLIRQR